jgi:hypothetical protein
MKRRLKWIRMKLRIRRAQKSIIVLSLALNITNLEHSESNTNQFDEPRDNRKSHCRIFAGKNCKAPLVIHRPFFYPQFILRDVPVSGSDDSILIHAKNQLKSHGEIAKIELRNKKNDKVDIVLSFASDTQANFISKNEVKVNFSKDSEIKEIKLDMTEEYKNNDKSPRKAREFDERGKVTNIFHNRKDVPLAIIKPKKEAWMKRYLSFRPINLLDPILNLNLGHDLRSE